MNKQLFSREVMISEFVARYLWSFLRVFLLKKLTRRCRRCIVPETYETLSENCLCSKCEHQSVYSDKLELVGEVDFSIDEIIGGYQGKGEGSYDALVLVSGGKDSAFVAHKLTEKFPKLRILTVLVDNGFMSPFALQNAKQMVEKMGLSYLVVKLDVDSARKSFRYALGNLDKQTGYSIVDLMDCFMTFDTARKLAEEMGCPLVISGVAKAQSLALFGKEYSVLSREQQWSQLKKTGLDLGFCDNGDMWYKANSRATATFVQPFVEWNPSEQEILDFVTEKGLLNKKHTSPLITNNALIPVIGMAEVSRFGYCSWEIEFSDMIRDKRASRTYWRNIFEMLQMATKSGLFVNKTVASTLAELDLELDQIASKKAS